MSAIVDIIGREILDSRGNPTVECDVLLEFLATGLSRFDDCLKRHDIDAEYLHAREPVVVEALVEVLEAVQIQPLQHVHVIPVFNRPLRMRKWRDGKCRLTLRRGAFGRPCPSSAPSPSFFYQAIVRHPRNRGRRNSRPAAQALGE